jgi:uncharacterized protein (TIGR02271 family)
VADQTEVVPLVREELEVSRRRVDAGGYRISKTAETREEVVDQMLSREDLSIERCVINKVVSVSDPPKIRHEGETVIVPVLEEVLFVERRLVLKEELRIQRNRSQVRHTERVPLRAEKILIERIEGDPPEKSNPE